MEILDSIYGKMIIPGSETSALLPDSLLDGSNFDVDNLVDVLLNVKRQM